MQPLYILFSLPHHNYLFLPSLQSLLDILTDTSLPISTLNVALHLAASLILIGQDSWGEGFGTKVATTVCGCGRERDVGGVRMVLNFFQEVMKDLEKFVQV